MTNNIIWNSQQQPLQESKKHSHYWRKDCDKPRDPIEI
jgi:hypothetical protein